MSYKKGDELAVKWATKLLLGKLSASFEGSTDSIDTTNDDSAGFKSSLPGDIGGSVSFSAIYDPAAVAGQGCEDLKADWLAKTVKTLVFGGTTVGDDIVSASAYISKFSQSASHGDKSTCDITFQITGAIALAVAAV